MYVVATLKKGATYELFKADTLKEANKTIRGKSGFIATIENGKCTTVKSINDPFNEGNLREFWIADAYVQGLKA